MCAYEYACILNRTYERRCLVDILHNPIPLGFAIAAYDRYMTKLGDCSGLYIYIMYIYIYYRVAGLPRLMQLLFWGRVEHGRKHDKGLQGLKWD